MKKSKYLAVLLAAGIFTTFAMGSGSSTPSSTTTVNVESSSATNETGSGETAEPEKPAEDEIQYEITDTNFEYYTNSIGRVEYYGYVEITNTGNCNLYLSKAIFDLEDNDGHLLQSDDFISNAPSVIKPGEKGYFYNGLGSNLIDESVSTDNGINLVPQITVKKATGEPTRYEVTDTDIKEGSLGAPTVTGRLVNDTSEEIGYIYINVIFYDANGKVLAITGTSLSEIPANGKQSFECSSVFGNDNVKVSDIANYEVIAEDTYMQF